MEKKKGEGKIKLSTRCVITFTLASDGASHPSYGPRQAGRKELVVAEVTRIEQEELRVRSVAQGQQGRWTTWEGFANRAISWAEFWKLPQARLSFLIRATYDTLPSPKSLHQWLGTEQSCDLCGTVNASLQHVLSGCKTALTQGRLRWRHDQVLRKLAEVLEKSRLEVRGSRFFIIRHIHNHTGYNQ